VTRHPRRFAGVLVAVALVAAACGGNGGGGASSYRQPAGPATSTVTVVAGNVFFDPSSQQVAAGVVDLVLEGAGGTHTLLFDGRKGRPVEGLRLEVSGEGDRQSLRVRLRPGKYVFYCDVIGHRRAGMEGTLTVR
jgi:plastocyanin